MREGTVFTGVCLSVISGGTPARSGLGGTPSQVWGGGGYSSQVWSTIKTWPGYPPATLGWGTPPTWDGVHPPHQDLTRVPPWMGYPKTEQHSGHLLRGGQYASCIHAGGLSCCQYVKFQLLLFQTIRP